MGSPFLHHVGVFVEDLEAAERFYTAALTPLGIEAWHSPEGGVEYWRSGEDTPSFAMDAVTPGEQPTLGVHVAFGAASRAHVDAFFEAALAAGGVVRHAPRHWPEFRAYCAFVSDPAGNNIEALIKDADVPSA